MSRGERMILMSKGGPSNYNSSPQGKKRKAKKEDGRTRLDCSDFLECFDRGDWDAFDTQLHQSISYLLSLNVTPGKVCEESVPHKISKTWITNTDLVESEDSTSKMSQEIFVGEVEKHLSPEEKSMLNLIVSTPDGKEGEVIFNEQSQERPLRGQGKSLSKRKTLFDDPYHYPDDSGSNLSQPIPYMSKMSDIEVDVTDNNGVDYQMQFLQRAENEIPNTIVVDTTDLSKEGMEEDWRISEEDIHASDSDCDGALTAVQESLAQDQVNPDANLEAHGAEIGPANTSQGLSSSSKGGRPKTQIEMKRTWDRKHFCVYCLTQQSNFTRHLKRKHRHEEDVQKYLAINDKDPKARMRKREEISNEIRLKGDHLYNSAFSKSNDDFLPVRRPSSVFKSIAEFLTCKHCSGMFASKSFYNHVKKCRKNPQKEKELLLGETNTDPEVIEILGTKQRILVQKSHGVMYIPEADKASDLIRAKIFPIIKKDKVGLLAMNDPLILSLASMFLSNHLDAKDVYNVTKKMRDAAKLVLECRKTEETFTFSDCFKVKNIEIITAACQSLCKLESNTGTVKVVGMPARLSFLFSEGNTCIFRNIITNMGLSQEEKKLRKDELAEFTSDLKAHWKYIISSNAEKTRKKKRCLKPFSMPDDDDIKTMADKIRCVEKKAYDTLMKVISWKNYENLLRATIAHILILNRRRPGEVARAELDFYLQRPAPEDIPQDQLDQLDDEEKRSLNETIVFSIPGKILHCVPIPLNKQMHASVELIMKCRDILPIQDEKLLFSRVVTKNPFDGSKIIAQFRKTCNLKKMSDMNCNGLRHHLATKSQTYGNDGYKGMVVDFMGHNRATHDTSYRDSLQSAQRGQVGKNLLHMAGETPQRSTFKVPDIPQQRCDTGKNEKMNEENPTISSYISTENDQNIQESTSCMTTSEIDQDDTNRNTPVEIHDDNAENELPGDYEADDLEDIDKLRSKYVSKVGRRNILGTQSLNHLNQEPQIDDKPPPVRKRWTEEDKDLVLQNLGNFVERRVTPGTQVCMEVLRKNPELKGRTWAQLKSLVNNFIFGKSSLPAKWAFLLEN